MENLIPQIHNCRICEKHLLLGSKLLITADPESKIIIISQAPGTPGSIVHASGIPWSDQSRKQLRSWLNVSEEQFYNPKLFAIIPMGFCYPGKGTSGDLPPRPECAPLWHQKLFDYMPKFN